jgi:Domain of unknown function (DUF5667)/FecR protein
MDNSNKTEQLENALRHIEIPSLDSQIENRMKKNVFMQIEGCRQRSASMDELKRVIKNVTRQFEPSGRAKIKENVMATIEAACQKDAWKSLFFNWQKVLASLMIAVIGITGTLVYIADIPVTMAARVTSFQDLYGTVEVLRDNVIISAADINVLYEEDVIITGADGIAVIRYFDDSITRLSYETELRIKKLYKYKGAVAETEVGLKLEKGRVWSQVINLVGEESSFQVETDEMSAVVLTTASFDMTNIKQNETKVAVFDEVVEVHLYGEIEDTKELVGSGYVAAVSEKDSEIQMIAFSESKEGDDQVWANLNTLKDLEYIDDVEKELEEKVAIEAGVLPGDSLYGAKKLNESAKLTVAGNETNNAKIKVDIAEKRLNEAGALLASGETEVAGEILDEFEQIIIEIDKVAQDIPEVNNYVNEMMGEALKDVAVLDNDSDLFPLKEVVEGAQIDILKSELQAGLEPSKIVQWGILKGNEHAVLHGAATEDASEQILPEEQE